MAEKCQFMKFFNLERQFFIWFGVVSSLFIYKMGDNLIEFLSEISIPLTKFNKNWWFILRPYTVATHLRAKDFLSTFLNCSKNGLH